VIGMLPILGFCDMSVKICAPHVFLIIVGMFGHITCYRQSYTY